MLVGDDVSFLRMSFYMPEDVLAYAFGEVKPDEVFDFPLAVALGYNKEDLSELVLLYAFKAVKVTHATSGLLHVCFTVRNPVFFLHLNRSPFRKNHLKN